MQRYLFHPHDNEINNFFYQNINHFNSHKFQFLQESDVVTDIRWRRPEPVRITENKNEYLLDFEFPQNMVFGSSAPTTGNTSCFQFKQLKDISKKKYAYVVLFYPGCDSNGLKNYSYLLTTLLVAYLLKTQKQNLQTERGTLAEVVVMITPDVDDSNVLSLLKLYFDRIIVVPYISSSGKIPGTIVIQDVSKGNIPKTHAYHNVFTKLHIFDQEKFPYEKVILLDSDLYPMCYFDSLFSLETPAGWLEHKRMIHPSLGVSSWIYDRQPMAAHGAPIPRLLTDIENSFASDINASLWIVKPNRLLYESMIGELKTPLSKWFQNRGFWLGNQYFDHYRLPEQNYLTKRLSGQWKSVDLGFCSWLLDLDYSFGFTFAGFVTKPWKIQSIHHQYHINPISEFSKINNQFTQRSTGVSLFNHLLFRMIKTSPLSQHLIPYLSNLQITTQTFDPWEPPATFGHMTNRALKDINPLYLSYDQKKLASLVTGGASGVVSSAYVLDVIARSFSPVYFTVLNRELIALFYSIARSLGTLLFPFGNSLISLVQTQYFDFTDDDNDFLLVVKNYEEISKLIARLNVVPDLQIFVRLRNNLLFERWSPKIDLKEILFFNISFSEEYVKKRFPDANEKWIHNHFSSVKTPWVDVFFVFFHKEKITFPNGKLISSSLFSKQNPFITEKYTNLQFSIPSNIHQYCLEYYGTEKRLDIFQIKTHHDSHQERKILLKISIREIDYIVDIFEKWNFYLQKYKR